MTDKSNLAEENLALVHACCKRFRGKGIEYDDLYSAGCVGLVKAVNNFNPDYGSRLSTYAVPVILGEIKRLFRDGGTVKVSRSLKELNLKINEAAKTFRAENGREPTVSELSRSLGESEEKISDALNAAKIPLSLSAPRDDEESTLDIPADDITEKLTERLALRKAILELPPRDRKIIELRYYKRATQQKTAEALGMTQVQISRREKKILTSIREKLTV
ncbi:MAG: sigma-70 family RNA polymerase sigma factor [Ruminococcus sp.]|nr:sigma-70 family RNA polymerase sigma factor [Ruminococcus sp.]